MVEAVQASLERDWRAQELAGVAGLTCSRLRAQFHRARGQTLHEFLQTTRLDRARLLLGD